MSTVQLLAIVARVEEIAAAKAISDEENRKLRAQFVDLNEEINELKKENEALNKDLLYERSISEGLSGELSKLKDLISAETVTVKLTISDDHPNLKIPLIKFVLRPS